LKKVNLFNLTNIAYYTLPIIGLLLLSFQIQKHFVNTPFYDEWTFYDKILTASGDFEFSLKKLFSPHNTHIISSTYLFYFTSFIVADLDFTKLIYVPAFLSLITIYICLIEAGKQSQKKSLFFAGLLSATALTPQAYENWTWPFQFQWACVTVAAISSFFFYTKFQKNCQSNVLEKICTLFFLLIASFSMAHGLLSLYALFLAEMIKYLTKKSLKYTWFIFNIILFFCLFLFLFQSLIFS